MPEPTVNAKEPHFFDESLKTAFKCPGYLNYNQIISLFLLLVFLIKKSGIPKYD